MTKKQLFNTSEIAGKTIKDFTLGDETFSILFSDDTFIVIRAYANDGWHGSGSCEIETDKWNYDLNCCQL